MELQRIFVIFASLAVSASHGATIPTAVDELTCRDLCSSCDGEAKFEDGHCECSIDADNAGTECLGRMKRQAYEYGLDVVSCDVENEEPRSARCTLAHKHSYGKTDMDRVAKYFMSDGPITGSIFIAPTLTHKAKHHANSVVGQSSNCGCPTTQGIITQPTETMVSSPLIVQPQEFVPAEPEVSPKTTPRLDTHGCPTTQGIITQPTETMVSSPLIVQPQEFMPAEPEVSPKTKPRLNTLGLQEIAPQFISMLGEVLTRPILGLPQAIQTVSEVPGVSELVGAPAHFLNSLADRMAGRSKMAKQNLDNYRDQVDKAREETLVGLSNYKEDHAPTVAKAAQPPPAEIAAPKTNSSPGYSVVNPHPMISWLNPTVGAPAPTQFVQTQLVGAPAPTQYVSSPQYIVGAPAPSSAQMVGSPLSFGIPSLAQLIGAALQPTHILNTAAQLINAFPTQLVSAPSPPSSNCGDSQIVGSPQMVSSVPMVQSLGTIVGQVSPTYLVSSPMSYYSPAVQPSNTIDDNHVAEAPSLEEVPFSSPPQQKKICKKSTRSMKYTRDVKNVADNEGEDVMMTTTTTTTTEVPMIERTTTQKPKTSVIGKIKPKKTTKVEKKF